MGNVVISARAITNHIVEVQFHAYCVDDYLEWYFIVSHPRVIPLVEHAHDVGPSDVRGPSNDVSPLQLLWMTSIV